MFPKVCAMYRILYLFIFLSLSCSLSVSSQNNFNDITNYLPSDFDVTGSVDYTSYIQKAVNEQDNVLMPNFPILINDKGINLKSNQKIKFQSNSSLILKASEKANYELLKIINSENITIINPVLIGDRKKHLSDKGEWGMGISIKGSRNIKIENARIESFWGDGIYIARNKNIISDNIIVSNSQFKENRRNGISIISGKNVNIQNCRFTNHRGVEPMAAIDIEPNTKEDFVDEINLSNIISENNGKSIQIGLSRYPESKKKINVNIDQVESLGDDVGLLIGGYYEKYEKPAQLEGSIKISNVTISNPKKKSVSLARYYKYGPKYYFKNIKINNSSHKDNYDGFKSSALERGLNVN